MVPVLAVPVAMLRRRQVGAVVVVGVVPRVVVLAATAQLEPSLTAHMGLAVVGVAAAVLVGQEGHREQVGSTAAAVGVQGSLPLKAQATMVPTASFSSPIRRLPLTC